MKTEDLELYTFSPSGILQGFFDDITERQGREHYPVDGSNPIFHLYEMSAQLHVDTNRRLYDTDKRHYAEMGMTEEELYAGMVGVDYLNRFATPGESTLILRVPVSEVLRNAVLDNDRNLRRLVIGKHSTFKRGDYVFSLHYPIEIRVLPSNGIQVVWDIEQQNPLQTKTTNQIETKRYLAPGEYMEVLEIAIPISQFRRDSTIIEAGTGGFQHRFPIAQSLYHVEVKQRRNNVWVPLQTTHDAITYDPQTPTAVLKRIDNELLVYIPQVYFTTNQISSPLRIDVLSTLGQQNADLITGGVFDYEWRDLDALDQDPAQVAMRNVNGVRIYPISNLRGGTNQKSLLELRDRKMSNAKVRTQPISDNELRSAATDMGYHVSLVKDALADRHYLLSRHLPQPTPRAEGSGDYALTGVNTSLVSTQLSLSQWKALEGAVWKDDLITIGSKQPWLLDAGLTPIMEDVLAHAKQTPRQWVDWLNTNPLVYSPFYYSFDVGRQYFEVKVFNMDTPSISGHRFIKENAKSNLMVSTGQVKVRRVDGGYDLLVSTRRSENLKDLPISTLGCQLSVVPDRSSRPVAMKGEYLGTDQDELVYRFSLPSDLLITMDGRIDLKGFSDGLNPTDQHPVALDHPFTLYWVVNNGETESSFDDELHRHLFSLDWVGLTKEHIDVRFGEALPHVYCNFRRIEAEPLYKTYDQDVMMTWEADVIKRDPTTKLPVGTWENGKFVEEYEHRKGDPVLDESGQQKVLYRAGVDIVYENGEPVILNKDDTGVVFDLLVLEGGYRSINANVTSDYYQRTMSTLLAYVSEDAPKLKGQLLPNTRASFSPIRTLGSVPVSVVTGEQFDLPCAQALTMTIYLTSTAYQDLALRESLRHGIHKAVYESLRSKDISLTKMQESITKTSSDIVAVGLDRLAGEFEAVQVLGSLSALCLAKEYFINDLGQIDIRDVIDISWVDHKQ